MDIKFKLLTPTMPNFIFYETPPGKRQDGMKGERNQIAVCDLNPEQAAQYAEEMRLAFLDHWKKSKQ